MRECHIPVLNCTENKSSNINVLFSFQKQVKTTGTGNLSSSGAVITSTDLFDTTLNNYENKLNLDEPGSHEKCITDNYDHQATPNVNIDKGSFQYHAMLSENNFNESVRNMGDKMCILFK